MSIKQKTLCVIMGGGKGSRMFPLTKYRSKPAVPLGGKYRLIDVPISNCLNSGLNKILILTQYNSESLNKHIFRTYKLDGFSNGYVEVLAASQTYEKTEWFQGTADSVRQSLPHINNPAIDEVIVLSGDQLYAMDLGNIQVYDTDSKEEAFKIQLKFKDLGIQCFLYEQGKKDVFGNIPKHYGISVPHQHAQKAQSILSEFTL